MRLSETDIQRIITNLGDLAAVICEADPADKARVYAGLRLKLTFQPAKQLVRAEAHLDPHDGGAMVWARGGTRPREPSTLARNECACAGNYLSHMGSVNGGVLPNRASAFPLGHWS